MHYRSDNRAPDQMRPVSIIPNYINTAEGSVLIELCNTRVICTPREVTRSRPSGRTHEIQRLIGRSLRAVCDLERLGERTIWIDCDVIQADGGTRTASITGAFVALGLVLEKLVEAGP